MLWITIDRTQPVPLIRQIYQQIRSRILQGELSAGFRLPSTRRLAGELEVSRNVVIEAYELLLAEGYVTSVRGAGHYVAGDVLLPSTAELAAPYQPAPAAEAGQMGDVIDFRSGIPALDQFPRRIWAQIVQQICRDESSLALGYDRPEGRWELRQAVCTYLLRTRGIRCQPHQIIITSGATQALTLIGKVLLSPGSEVLIEDPITCDIQTIFTEAGGTLIPISVDESGMQTADLPADGSPRFLFVTPSHQFPLGGTMPIQRRIQLIQYARSHDCYIVEDDYDSEFRYEGAPVSAIKELDSERVIYIGTYSKTLSPMLRLGYLVLPEKLVTRYKQAKWFTDLHTPSLDQLTLARFIEQGHLDRHIARMKKLYRRRRTCLISALQDAFSDQVRILGESTGLHLVAQFPGFNFTLEQVEQILSVGVRIYPVEQHAIVRGKHPDKLIIGYANLTEEQIREGVQRLKTALAP
ncbi:PLP-dependent aminotransferase family protein [Brevibacillus humidisoli]|uniref:MocR-like pyridoxine biosynthesis transcription factor PdxR n=1 Tax=Brevibacillus humidisoli TaxID=2895522 RepID=UPI001E3CE35B|nr:PLP-dependent aminotransferase family protein [Brevibacillus humidisoli]UFJ39871.1 PLP-dependent aminotransferase family protein [Brevibacillus humidisoli]